LPEQLDKPNGVARGGPSEHGGRENRTRSGIIFVFAGTRRETLKKIAMLDTSFGVN
jgi:hypothetical protein